MNENERIDIFLNDSSEGHMNKGFKKRFVSGWPERGLLKWIKARKRVKWQMKIWDMDEKEDYLRLLYVEDVEKKKEEIPHSIKET